ncbi:hypothetical protein EV426DRAFT_332233 [Tirmania nivea]|nr:hypothetical protein EV426DRAFT_332233 [Tirmania nivea]
MPSASRHIVPVFTGVTVAVVIISIHLYIHKRYQHHQTLKRSNARRIRPRRNSRSRRGSPSRTASAPASTSTVAALASTLLSSSADQTTVANAQAIPRPVAYEQDPGDMSDNGGEVLSTRQLQEQLNRGEAIDDDDDDAFSTGIPAQQDTGTSDYSVSPETAKENQNLLNLLYLIAEDQAKREGYVHRGVSCNSCSVQPIRGIRYRCANCVDFDLCEHCESLDSHPRTHLFYKVRIPAQFLGNPRHVQPPSYPGKPGNMPLGLGMELAKEFEKKSGFDQAEVEALYEQFKCLAATEYQNDPYRIGGAINRKTFDKCIYLSFSDRPPPPNLIYDRMFALYDTNNDGLIGFEEFLLGLAALHTKPRLDDKWKRIFKGYDLDGDGYVERKDFLKMFRAYYALSKEHVQDIVARMEEEMIESGASTNVLLGSQPISAAFPSLSLEAHVGEGKSNTERNQDMLGRVILPSGNDNMTQEELHRFRAETLGRDAFVVERESTSQDSSSAAVARGEEEDVQHEPRYVLDSSLFADGDTLSDSENIPPAQEGQGVPGITTTDISFAGMDDNIDYYTIAPEAEEDVGNEVLYQVTQQGLNELLNMLFKVKEDEAAEVRKRQLRREKEAKAKKAAQSSVASSSKADSVETELSQDINLSADSATINLPIEAGPSSSASTPPIDPTTPSKAFSSPVQAGFTNSKAHSKYERYKAKMESDHEKFLDKIEAEMKERGGPGRINYDEFEKLMRQDGWRRFAFVGSWVDMVSF